MDKRVGDCRGRDKQQFKKGEGLYRSMQKFHHPASFYFYCSEMLNP
jgi:hypothetical protein